MHIGFSGSYEAYFLRSLFSLTTGVPQNETMDDRASAVAHIQLNPVKFVGYVDETISFSALASDFLDRMIQGVKFDWDELDHSNKLQIDEAGRATFLHPGLARITCRAGSVEASAAILIRPDHRPVQTDPEWRADQASIKLTGNTGGVANEPTLLSSLLDKLAPTAYAQSGSYYGNDFAYDQLWSEPRNLVGSPNNRVIEPTALGAVQPEGSNFDMSIPLVSLGGRGLAGSLTLYYNSRVWGRHGNAVTFDPIASWPTPGFSLGFGRIVTYGVGKFLLIEPDGTRRYLGTSNGYFTGGTTDGSHVIYSGSSTGGYLYRPDGTSAYFSNVNNRLLPTSIQDRNGNFIVIAYKPIVDEYGGSTVYPPQAIDYVTDTLGRIIHFNYDASGRLINITTPGFGGTTQNPVTQTIAKFDYQTRTLGYSFSGLAVENVGYGVFDALRHVCFPATCTGYLFTYSGYGMIYNYSVRRQMSISGSTISDGVESAAVSFNYPTSGSTVLTDAPAFTQRTETAVSSPTSVYTYSTSTDSIAQTTTFTITRPDSTTVQLTRSTNGSSPANGRLVQTELKNGAASFAKSVLTYVNDGGGSPQVQSTTGYDDTGTPMKVDFDYDVNGNVTNKRDYGYQINGAWQVRRRTHLAYTSIANAVNLVTEADVYDALQDSSDSNDVLIAKSTYAYDNYVAMGGMENYGGGAAPPGHLSWYDANLTQRGNVTGVTQWTDLAAGTTIQHLSKLDIFGNVVKAQVSCCQEKDLTNTQATYWSQHSSEMSGDPFGVHQTTSTDFDFNTSLPKSATDAGGLTTNVFYDAALNPNSVSLPTGASANSGYDYGNLSASSSVSYIDGTDQWGDPVSKTITTSQVYDGWGRMIQSVDKNNGQVNTGYDAMGRVASRTNPFTAGGTPGPAMALQYDSLGRGTITTLPGGNTVQNSYSGATVTTIDQVNRKIQRISDGLGRLITVNEQDAIAGLTQATTYTYDLLDNLTAVNQGGQTRSYKYDAIGRLLYERIPEQSATINDGTGTMWSCRYTYTEFSAMATRQDARGVVTSYSYDSLHRVGGISYDTTTAPGVAATGPVSFGYTAWGAVANVSVGYGDYGENYTFDSFNRPASVSRIIQHSNSSAYTTSYQYNGADQLAQMTYPSGNVVGVTYDSRGRMSAESDVVGGISYNVAGQVTGLTLTNGVSETFAYDTNRMQLTSQVVTKSGGPTGGLMNLIYNYQASGGQMGTGTTAGNAGQLMSISGTVGGSTESAGYTYDNLGRLVTSSQTSNGATAQRRFNYDRWGNRKEEYDSTSGGNQIQSISLAQSGELPQTEYKPSILQEPMWRFQQTGPLRVPPLPIRNQMAMAPTLPAV